MRREYVWALITLIIAIFLAYLLIVMSGDNGAPSQYEIASTTSTIVLLPPAPSCVDAETRERIQRLTDRAIDQGFQQHVANLFSVLMGNPNSEQYKRAQNGMQNGIRGYLTSHKSVDEWIPPLC